MKGFSRAVFKGYTIEGGGRAAAVREFQEHVGEETLREEETTASACRDVGGSKNTPTRSSEEPARVHVLGHMLQPSTPYHYVAHQLETPPSTLNGTKRERPTSWDADQDSYSEAISVGDDGAPEAATGLEQEHTHFHITPHTAQSAKLSICHADDCSIDSSSASQAPLGPTCSNMVANNTSSDNQNCSSGTRSSDKGIASGNTAEGAALSRQVLLATDSEDNSGASTVLSDGCSNENSVISKDIYPRLPVFRDPDGANSSESPPHDRNIATNLNVLSDKTSLAPDYISLGTSSDYGDFIDDPAVLDRVSSNGPRTEPLLCDEQLALVCLILSGQNVFYTGSAGCGKSTVLKHFIPLLRKEGKKVDVLAPTGRAALEVQWQDLAQLRRLGPALSQSAPREARAQRSRQKGAKEINSHKRFGHR